jgi:hypothetical protein
VLHARGGIDLDQLAVEGDEDLALGVDAMPVGNWNPLSIRFAPDPGRGEKSDTVLVSGSTATIRLPDTLERSARRSPVLKASAGPGDASAAIAAVATAVANRLSSGTLRATPR